MRHASRIVRTATLLTLLAGLSIGCAPGWQERFHAAQQYGEASFNRRAGELIVDTLTLQNTTLVSCTSTGKGRRSSTSCIAW
jgi:hypothetical protein